MESHKASWEVRRDTTHKPKHHRYGGWGKRHPERGASLRTMGIGVAGMAQRILRMARAGK